MALDDAESPAGSWHLHDLVPRPDPTVLTNAAIAQVTAEYRRDLGVLKEFLESKVDNLSQLTALRASESEKAVRAAFASANEAVTKAETANEKRLDSVNEFRAQMQDLIAGFITRREYETSHGAVIEALDVLRHRLEDLTSQLVPRNETDAWRNALTEKSDLATSRNYEAIHRLESRFDTLQGQSVGAQSSAQEQRTSRGMSISSGLLTIAGISAFLSLAGIIVAIIAVVHK